MSQQQLTAEIHRLRVELAETRAELAPLDEVVHELGIENSETSPVEAIKALRAELAETQAVLLASAATGARHVADLRAELLSIVRLELDQVATEGAADREEIAWLRGALEQVRKDLAPIHLCDVNSRHCKICEAVIHIDAALAPRPQEDKP